MNLLCKFKAFLLLTATTLMLAQNAQAIDEAAPPVSPSTGLNVESYHQLDVLRSQNAILAETVKNKELRRKLSDTDSKNSPEQPKEQPSSGIPGPPSNVGKSSFSPSAQVAMVSGMGSNLTALITMPNGGQVVTRVGNHIAGIGQIKSISPNEVMVLDKQQTISLPFASENGVR